LRGEGFSQELRAIIYFMTKTTFLFYTLISTLALFIYHTITLKLNLFFISPILDVPSHILGGFVTAMFLTYFAYDFVKMKGTQYQNFFLFIGVLIVGILWEIFEIKFDFFLTKDGYWFDTNLDIVCDLLGALLANIFFIKKLYGRK
jgi:hypothetical protein